MSQLAHIEKHHECYCKNKRRYNQDYAFCNRADDEFTTCASENLLCIDSPDTLRNLRKEEVDIVNEGDAYDEQGYNDKDDCSGLASSFNWCGDICGIIQVFQRHELYFIH